MHIIHHVDDVSEKARENRILMQLAMDHAAIGAWVFDPATGLATSSEEVRRMFGTSTSEAPEDLFSWVHPEDRSRVEVKFNAAVETGNAYETEFRIVKKGEVRWIRSKGRLLDARVGPARLIGFAEDITERKNAEQALAESQKELEEAVGRVGDHLSYRSHRTCPV